METTLVERHQLKNIENRLENVEKSLYEIIENGEMMEERIKEKLMGIHEEIENNTRQVQRMKLKMGQGMRPITIFAIILGTLAMWTFCLSWFH